MDIDEIIEFLFLQLKKIFNYIKLDININNIENILYEIFYNSNNCNYIDKQNILLYIQQYKYIINILTDSHLLLSQKYITFF